jgi:hypothetical protein
VLRGPKSKALLVSLVLAVLTAVAVSATAVTIRTKDLELRVLGQVLPNKLPRDHPAPVAAFISGHVKALNQTFLPQLQKMAVKVSRHGLLRPQGIPACSIDEIQPASTERALANCGDAIIGSGRFWAWVVLPEQRRYPTRGRLLIFNGRRHRSPVLFAHIYTSRPFNSSFVITFKIKHLHGGPFGTELKAEFPKALGSWGYVDRIKLTLRRKFEYRGRERSYYNASCPAPRGAHLTSYRLAKASFYFGKSRPISLDVVKSCRVKE